MVSGATDSFGPERPAAIEYGPPATTVDVDETDFWRVTRNGLWHDAAVTGRPPVQNQWNKARLGATPV